MGRLAVILDPSGYSYCQEPGLHYEITGDELMRRLGVGANIGELDGGIGFYNPPGSEWLLPRPRQFDPNWTKDQLILDQYVLQAAHWNFASGVTAVEWDPSKKPGTAGNPANKWLSAYIPAGTTSLDSTSYTALGIALGFDLPADLVTVAVADAAPTGLQLSEWDYHPWLSHLALPGPDNSLVFGFADLAFVFYGDSYGLLRTPENDKQTWELLARGNFKTQNVSFAQPPSDRLFASTLATMESVRANVQSFCAIPVGWEHLYLHFGEGPPVPVKLREATPDLRFDRLLKAGSWWIGANPGRSIKFQAQVVGYVESGNVTEAAKPLFDLGASYKPTAEPELDIEFRMGTLDSGTITETVNGSGRQVVESPDTGEQILYALTDENYDVWASDGTHSKGNFELTLSPYSPDGPATYLAPQFRRLVLRFPPVLAARKNAALTLPDTQWAQCGAEVSLYEPLGKRVWVDLWDSGLQRLTATGHDLRDSYPIHLAEDVDGDGVYETIRAAGWIDEPETTLHHSVHPVTGLPIYFHRLQGRGLLSRLDQAWEYLPQLVDPLSDGYIEHPFAIRETLVMSGFDWIDPLVYAEADDPYAGTDVARLPGTWKAQNGVIGHRNESPWGPEWSETRIAYCERVAKLLAGWLIHEQLDKVIRYHPDLLTNLQLGAEYWRDTTLYATHAAAALAGVPGQVYAPLLTRRNLPPEANVIRVHGKADETNLLPQIIERATASIEMIANENFLGDRKVKELTSRAAVDETTMRKICRRALLLYGRRRVLRSVEVPQLAPWQLSPGPVVVGSVLAVQGMGDLLVSHVEFTCVKSSATNPLYETRLTVERLPAAAVLGAAAGDYPGSGSSG